MDLRKYSIKEVINVPKLGLQKVILNNGQTIELKQSWYNSILEEGDLISINLDDTKFDESQELVTIDDRNGFIVLNPDQLITITDLSNLSYCYRKTWLTNRFRPIKDFRYNHATLLGTLIHELFQITINEKDLTRENLYSKLIDLIKQPSVLKALDYLNLTSDNLVKDSKIYVDSIVSFNRKFNSNQPAEFDQAQPNLKLKINRVTDIEDSIFCPKLGLKGKIDVRMDVEIHDRRTGKVVNEKSIPFELKTGQVSYSFAHQAQVNLYTLMTKNESNSNFGLLAYLKDGLNLKYITVNNFIRNALIQQRNELVHHLKYLDNGPETRSNTSFCHKCDHLLDCCLMGEIFEPEKLASFKRYQPDLITNTLSHLDNKYRDFFKQWIEMIFIEEKYSIQNFKSNFFWNKTSIELEKDGLAIAKLVLERKDTDLFEYVFRRSSNFKDLGSLPVDIQYNKILDRVSISIENDNDELERIGLVNGVIVRIDENEVMVQLDEHIKSDYLDKTFRIDVFAHQSNYSFLYTSILRLMSAETNSKFLRHLIIDKERPSFNNTRYQLPHQLELLESITKNLNVCQREAVSKTLKMNDYLLIKGFPGSGKTETIVHIVKLLTGLGKTVVITAHTNQAVDNVLLKLLKHDIKFMRIGNVSKMHPNLIKYSEDFLAEKLTSKDEFDKQYNSVNVFASTCVSINSHILFEHRIIEYCILDEASQLSFPESLVPLFGSMKFILVGDPEQLPPIVRSTEAKEAHLDKTLFDLLYENEYEESIVELTIQYRMNKEIMRLANECTYDNKLVCGSKKVENQVLCLTVDDKMTSEFDTNSILEKSVKNEQIKLEDDDAWIDGCLNTKDIGLSVLFLNTDNRKAKQDVDGNGQVFNHFEINVIVKLLTYLNEKNYPMNEIGIISPYNRQVKSIKALTKQFDVECSTIDQYQGRDKDIIIISCVKSDNEVTISSREILNDKRRINVAITRAKKKLIVIGSKTTLTNYEPIRKFLSCLNDKQIINI